MYGEQMMGGFNNTVPLSNEFTIGSHEMQTGHHGGNAQSPLLPPRGHSLTHTREAASLENSLSGLRPVDLTASKNEPIQSRNGADSRISAAQPSMQQQQQSSPIAHNNPIVYSNTIDVASSPQRLKAQVNSANGGIGVSYSNVVLAGGLDPNVSSQGKLASNYQSNFNSRKESYPPGYSAGLDFNAKVKYEYNILNGQHLSTKSTKSLSVRPPILQNAGSSMIY